MPGKPISQATADVMIEEYIGYMTGLGVNMNNQTQSVSFTAAPLMTWLNKKMGEADELKIFMGLYPPGHTQAGHTTVILWPYKNGEPLPGPGMNRGGGDPDDAFNDGHGNP